MTSTCTRERMGGKKERKKEKKKKKKKTHTHTPRSSSYILYLGNKEIHYTFQKCCIISLLFSTKCHLFQILSFSVQIIHMFFINHVLKFKYQPSHLILMYLAEQDFLNEVHLDLLLT
jgi:hypothetical protein